MSQIPLLELKLGQITEVFAPVLEAGLVPMLHGRPGAGKSASIKALADHFNLELIDIRLSQFTPSALNGFPVPNRDTRRSEFFPVSLFPLEDTPLPEGRDGWLIFFDELTSALPAIQVAAYRILLDKEVGEHKLNHNVFMVAAGNRVTDGAVANKMSTALQSRMVHFVLGRESLSFIEHGQKNNFDHRILSYVEFAGVTNFDPKHKDLTYSCERTWDFVNNFIKGKSDDYFKDSKDNTTHLIFQGCIGATEAAKFLSFLRIYADLTKYSDIVKFPDSAPVPSQTQIDRQFALSGVIVDNVCMDDIDNVVTYISRLNFEIQAVIMRKIAAAPAMKGQLTTTTAFKRWNTQFAKAKRGI